MNWREIIMDLNGAGLSGAEIARKLKSSTGTINGLKNEKRHEPSYALGESLKDLHARVKAAGLMRDNRPKGE